MMVLFAITVGILTSQTKVLEEIIDEIKNVQTALDGLDKEYFEFDSHNKRYKLNREIAFTKDGTSDINNIPNSDREFLLKAGKELYQKIDSLIRLNPNIDYLLVIEGNNGRKNNNHLTIPDKGYRISYNRALSLVNYWKDNDVNFYHLGKQCELIIAGSGYFGQSRDETDETKNMKFSIQVTSKVGKFLEKTK